jgi:hypothetical protein
VLSGDVDVDGDFIVDYSGTLLTGEIAAFGSEDSGGNIDLYDFRFVITGGALASMYDGKDLGVTTTSENSSFAGNFNVNFGGNAKGEIGGEDRPENPGIDVEKFVKIMKKDDHKDDHDKCGRGNHNGSHHGGSDEYRRCGPQHQQFR